MLINKLTDISLVLGGGRGEGGRRGDGRREENKAGRIFQGSFHKPSTTLCIKVYDYYASPVAEIYTGFYSCYSTQNYTPDVHLAQ